MFRVAQCDYMYMDTIFYNCNTLRFVFLTCMPLWPGMDPAWSVRGGGGVLCQLWCRVVSVMCATRPSTCFTTTSYPGSFHYAPRWRKDPGPGWSRVSQILGDNNWDLWGVGKANVAFEFKTIQGWQGVWIEKQHKGLHHETKFLLACIFHKIRHNGDCNL